MVCRGGCSFASKPSSSGYVHNILHLDIPREDLKMISGTFRNLHIAGRDVESIALALRKGEAPEGITLPKRDQHSIFKAIFALLAWSEGNS